MCSLKKDAANRCTLCVFIKASNLITSAYRRGGVYPKKCCDIEANGGVSFMGTTPLPCRTHAINGHNSAKGGYLFHPVIVV